MNWLNLILMAVLSLGNFAIVVAVVNRVHVTCMHLRTLSFIRRIHVLLVIGFTVFLIWYGGFGRPRLLLDGSWLDIAPIYQIYFAVCGASALVAAVIVIRRWCRKSSDLQLARTSEVIDVAGTLSKPLLAKGPYSALAHLPRNEILSVEISKQDFQLPGLPANWDGLSILHVSDLHFIGTISQEYFAEVLRHGQELRSDMVVFTGDLLDDQSLTAWLPETLGQLQAPLGCYFILGNHDWELDPDATRKCLQEIGWIDVAGRHVTVEHAQRKLLIAGTEYPWMGKNPDTSAAADADFRLLLSHTPDNYTWARRNRFDLMLSGHTHGGQVRVPVIGPIYTPSLYGTRYSSGAFFEPPTLLYVTRGLSGKEPLRYNCMPELTQLVLHPATVPAASTGKQRNLVGARR